MTSEAREARLTVGDEAGFFLGASTAPVHDGGSAFFVAAHAADPQGEQRIGHADIIAHTSVRVQRVTELAASLRCSGLVRARHSGIYLSMKSGRRGVMS